MYRSVFLILAILPGVFSFPVTGEATLPEECQQKDCPDGSTYHCLTNEHWDVVNICMKRRMMPSGMCPYYNSYQGYLDARACEGAMRPGDCPTENFYSHDGSKYPNCMSEYVMPSATQRVATRNLTTDMTSTSSDFELEKSIMTAEAGMQETLHTAHDSKTNGGVVAGVVIMVILLSIALSFFAWIVVMKRRDRNFSFQQWFRRRKETCRCAFGQDDGHRNLNQHRTENSEDSPFLQNTAGEVSCEIPNLHANVVVSNGDVSHVESQINDDCGHDTEELDVRSGETNPDANTDGKNNDLAFHSYSVHSNPECSCQKHTVSSETSETVRSPSDNCNDEDSRLHENARNESEQKEPAEFSSNNSATLVPDGELEKDLRTRSENPSSTDRGILAFDSKENPDTESFPVKDNSKNIKDNETATESAKNEDKGGDQIDSKDKEECTANVEYSKRGAPVQPKDK